MSELGKFKHLGYHPQPCGRSYHRVKCECDRIVDIYAWRGTKKCDCGRVLSIRYSHEAKEIVVTAEDLGIKPVPQVKVTAPCITCGKEIHYVHGMGWSHEGDRDFDHPALPVPDRIKRTEEKEE
jgi:hypothetical protein